jgi:exodeoxyribonuclease V gamma subunit
MTGLNLYTGNRLELLVDRLAAKMKENPLPVLQQETVVVQSKGMQHWLSLELADRNQICANISYPFPRAFIYNLFQGIVDITDEISYSPDGLTWKIMRSLPDLLELDSFRSLRSYCEDGHHQLRLYQLSEKIAALFDRYLIFRPELILEWDKGINPMMVDCPDTEWQCILWQEMIKADQKNEELTHPPALRQRFLEKDRFNSGIPDRVSVFGISSLPPFYLDIFHKLAEQIEIDFYYLNPCREFWEYSYGKKEISRLLKEGLKEEDQYFESGNPLLASMGVAGREFFSLILNQMGDTGEEIFEAPDNNSLLANLQLDILNLVGNSETGIRTVNPEDRTVQIHSCHTPIREVEVLHDNLLDLFETGRNLAPRDVVVMMPDVSTYAPIIQAVFDAPESEKMALPYSIADLSLHSGNQTAETLLSILTLNDKRFAASEVLDILEVQGVRDRFQFNENELDLIKSWVVNSGIKWGIDGESKKEINLPPFPENTWLFGLKRMLLGTVLPQSEDLQLFEGILPFDEIEGDRVMLLGRFMDFVDRLIAISKELKQPKDLTSWSVFLNGILNDFFVADEKNEHQIQILRDRILEKGLQDLQASSGYESPVSLKIILSYLQKQVDQQSGTGGFISRGITFCTMLPMRSIPFKVIALLGMNDGEFPRRFQLPGFNLMRRQKRLCDPSRREEDKYLFLESLFSARETLIISYIGQSIKDNSVLPPSVLVSELCDYLEQGFRQENGESVMEYVFYKHALQPFNSQYFDGKSRYYSYSGQNLEAARMRNKQKQEEKPFLTKPLLLNDDQAFRELSLGQFCRFFKNPCETLIRFRLDIDLRLKSETIPDDRELFEADNLELYKMREKMIDYCGTRDDPSPFLASVKAGGGVAHGNPGEMMVEEMVDGVDEMLHSLQMLRGGKRLPFLPVEFKGKGREFRLSGVLQELWEGGQVLYRPASIKARDILNSWIHHLLLCTHSDGGGIRKTWFIGRDQSLVFRSIEADRAAEELEKLMEIFFQGLIQPLEFFPETSLAYCRTFRLSAGNEEKAMTAALKEWNSNYIRKGEEEDEYFRLCFTGYGPGSTEFKELAIRIFDNALEFCSEGRGDE